MNKACPVVLRVRGGVREILAFRHPSAGLQIVKGTIEPGEALARACVRELEEESGIRSEAGPFLGEWQAGYDEQVWGFHEMHCADELPETWQHFTEDGGGRTFTFFWQPLDDPPTDDGWHPVFIGALAFVRSALSQRRAP